MAQCSGCWLVGEHTYQAIIISSNICLGYLYLSTLWRPGIKLRPRPQLVYYIQHLLQTDFPKVSKQGRCMYYWRGLLTRLKLIVCAKAMQGKCQFLIPTFVWLCRHFLLLSKTPSRGWYSCCDAYRSQSWLYSSYRWKYSLCSIETIIKYRIAGNIGDL